MRKVNELRDRRDAVNDQVKKVKKERKNLYQQRDKVSEQKNGLANKLVEVKGDGKQEDKLLREIHQLDKKQNEFHRKAREKHQEVQDLADQSQNYHVEMLATRMMGKQAHQAADNYHEQLKSIQKEIRKLRKEIWKSKRAS